MPRAVQIPSSSDRVDLGPGRTLRLDQPIGKGSGSTVWRATLATPNGMVRAVALKMFGTVATDDAEAVHDAIFQAARRVACVRHPNVVEVYETGLHGHGQQAFMIEELVEGVTLAALTERVGRRMPLDLALFIASEVAEALNGARTARGSDGVQLGLCHLGLTQKEILLSWRGEVKVSDFELTTARGATSSIRSLGQVAMRATMMAPEIAQGMEGDARSDVFSLGVLLRELLVGPRFPAGIKHAEAVRLGRQGYIEPYTFQPHLPEHLVWVMQRCLAVQPRDRFPNASAVAFELRRLALGLGVGDGRIFLRRALDREFESDVAEVTTEHTPAAIEAIEEVVVSSAPQTVVDDEPMPVSASDLVFDFDE